MIKCRDCGREVDTNKIPDFRAVCHECRDEDGKPLRSVPQLNSVEEKPEAGDRFTIDVEVVLVSGDQALVKPVVEPGPGIKPQRMVITIPKLKA